MHLDLFCARNTFFKGVALHGFGAAGLYPYRLRRSAVECYGSLFRLKPRRVNLIERTRTGAVEFGAVRTRRTAVMVDAPALLLYID